MVAKETSTPSHTKIMWIAEDQSFDIYGYGKELEVLTKESVHGICHQWCEDRALTLLEGAPQPVTAWSRRV